MYSLKEYETVGAAAWRYSGSQKFLLYNKYLL